MLLFARRYVTALIAVLVCMGGYGLLVVPFIEPPPRPPTPLPEFPGALGGPQWWQVLFADHAWQRQNPRIIQSKRGVVLLSQNYVQSGPRTLKLHPLTIVLPQSSPSETEQGIHDVLIIRAEQGAEIHFEEDFDPSGSIPSIERGELSGKIEVTRRVYGQTNSFPWTLHTSNLSLNRTQISTPQAVTIEWADGIISGHDMRLAMQGDLLGNRGTSLAAGSAPWGPLRSLELYHLDRCEIKLPEGGLWGQTKLSNRPELDELKKWPGLVTLQCGGRFTFDFTQSQATLVNGVQVTHQVGQGPADEFQSQEVLIQLEAPAGLAAHTKGTHTKGTLPNGMQLRVIEATGIDSLENFVGEQKVELRAPTIDAYATAKRLRIDLLENRIELDGKLNRPGATQSTAWLKYMGYEFSAPRIDYDRDGRSAAANPPAHSNTEHLGYLLAAGAGEMRAPAESSLGRILVRWQDSLEMRPSEASGQQWLGLFGKVLVESALHGYMACDEMQIWLRDQGSQQLAGDLGQSSLSVANSAAASLPSAQYLPERIQAAGRVSLNTTRLQADVGQLNLAVNFVGGPNPNSTTQAALALSDSAGRPMYQWLTPPVDATPPLASPQQLLDAQSLVSQSLPAVGSLASAGQPTGPNVNLPTAHTAQKLHVVGSSLDSIVIVAGPQSWVDNLTVAGPLVVSAKGNSPTAPTWQVQGSELQLATNAQGQADIQVTGQPAQITLAEGSLQGPSIRFDQKSNLIWMDQPGEFTLPMTALNADGSAGDNNKLSWFEPPHCTWQGRMIFDGHIVRMEGEIRFDGAVAIDQNQFWWLKGQAEVLQLELAEKVDFDDLQSNLARPNKMTLSQNVLIMASQLDAHGTKKSRQQIEIPSLTFDLQTHELIGLGPGSIRSWMVTKDSSPLLASTLRDQAGVDNLQGAHLTFRESMRGFMDRSEVYFQGKVELAVGPLESWRQAIDLANMQRLTMNQLHLDCDLLKVFDTSGLSSTRSQVVGAGISRAWEFVAKGNVRFAGKAESGDYEGDGSELAYVQAKELLTLLGEPRRPGTVIIKPSDPQKNALINVSVEYAAINPRLPSLESFKMGQRGIDVQLVDPANPVTAASPTNTSTPAGSIPNPRGTVSDYLRK